MSDFRDIADGRKAVVEVSGGALKVANVGLDVQAHNRVMVTAGSTLPADIATATWAESEGVYMCRFKVTGGTAGHRIRVVFDASPVDDDTDTTQAATWLAAVTPAQTADTDVEYFEITQGADFTAAAGGGFGEWSDWFQFSNPLRRVDAISVDADVAQTIFIEVG